MDVATKKRTRQHRSYSDEDKAIALAALDANAGDFIKTSKMLHIPRTTLIEWHKGRIHPVVTELRQEKKADLAERLEHLAGLLIDDLTSVEIRREASFGQLATGLGITIDKMRLLRGETTENVGVQVDVGVKQDAQDELAEWRQQQQNAIPSTATVLNG